MAQYWIRSFSQVQISLPVFSFAVQGDVDVKYGQCCLGEAF